MSARNESRAARLGRCLLNLLCVVVTLLAVAFLVPGLLGLQRYAIAGGSMTGTYDLGSIVFDKVVPVSALHVGDVITYLPPADSNIDNLVTHRIVSIDGNTYRTKGDANPDVDPWTFRLTSSTQPRVVASVPYVGWVLLGLQSRHIRMLAIGVPAALIALLSLVQLVRGLRGSRRGTATAPVVAAGAILTAPVPQRATSVVLVSTDDHPRPLPALPRQRAASRNAALPRQRGLDTPSRATHQHSAGHAR